MKEITGFTEVSQVNKLETLKVIDNYVIKNHLLGEGSYAKTYLAIKSGNQIVACKMISKKNLRQKINKSSNKEFTQDFLTSSIRNEVQVWKKCRHNNIASFKDYQETENNVYFFIQYCAGGTLQSLISKSKFNHREAITIFEQIVNGCQYLYEMGILHRDLKPENIMIHKGVIKIADFGFAKFVEDQTLKNSCLQRTYVGTPVYMSPQGLMRQPYSIKCDVWSIGVIFYRLLCFNLPWPKFDKLQFLIQAVKTPPSIPKHVEQNELLEFLILKMLNFSQKDRIGIMQISDQLSKVKQYQIQ